MALAKCTSCPNRVDRYYVSPTTGAKYCCDCWDAIYPSHSAGWMKGIFVIDRIPQTGSPFTHIATGAVTTKELTTTPEGGANMFGNLQCSACKASANEGEYAGADWICKTCLADDSDPNCDALPAKVHFSMKAKGNKVAIEYFNFMMKEIDIDWPGESNSPICHECGGLQWPAPTMSPKELKQLAGECGVGKLKIRYWGDAVKCAKVVV